MTEEEFSDYWPKVVDKKFSDDHQLTEEENIFYAVNCLRGAVLRSSLVGYLENVDAEEIRDAIQGLESLGLIEASEKLKETASIYLQGDILEQTQGLLADKYSKLNEEEYDKFELKMFEKLGSIEDYFMEQDDVFFDALCRHADQNKLNKKD